MLICMREKERVILWLRRHREWVGGQARLWIERSPDWKPVCPYPAPLTCRRRLDLVHSPWQSPRPLCPKLQRQEDQHHENLWNAQLAGIIGGEWPHERLSGCYAQGSLNHQSGRGSFCLFQSLKAPFRNTIYFKANRMFHTYMFHIYIWISTHTYKVHS